VLRFPIKLVNGAWLVIIFIGVPAITHAQFGDWQLASTSRARLLIFWGLALGAAGNALLAMAVKKDKDRIFCWEWTTFFGVLLAVQYAYAGGYLNFHWLKNGLLWGQNHL
jgi:hypothetical protein